MFDRIRMAIKCLFVREIIVVTKNEQFSTMNNSSQFNSSSGGKIVWGNFNE